MLPASRAAIVPVFMATPTSACASAAASYCLGHGCSASSSAVSASGANSEFSSKRLRGRCSPAHSVTSSCTRSGIVRSPAPRVRTPSASLDSWITVYSGLRPPNGRAAAKS